jgi:hypothetical protein
VEGFSPLHYAAGEGFLDITRYLVEECGGDPEVPDNLGLTPGFCAVLQARVCARGSEGGGGGVRALAFGLPAAPASRRAALSR